MVGLFLEQIKVVLGTRGLWRIFPSHQMRCLLQFEATEDDSAWQLIWACNNLDDPKQKAELFAQILEESHHAELFRKVIETKSSKLNRNIPSRIQIERRALYHETNNIWKYFPYCIVGETSAAKRFELILRSLPKKEEQLKATLKQIVSDETGHIHKAKSLASELNKSVQELRSEIKSIRWRRFKEDWVRSGKKLLTPVGHLIILTTYYVALGPFAFIRKLK